MLNVLILWLTFTFLSFGVLGLNFLYTRHAATKLWKIKKNKNYVPKVWIIVPTYNEHEVIGYKLRNLAKVEYPKDLIQIVSIDSQSTDSTVNVIRKFAEDHPEMNIKILVEKERKGKSSALNTALKHCSGDIVIVTDADCFWPSNILTEALPYLSDPTIGAISGPKKLLNPESSCVTKTEDVYLKSMNLMRLGESKKSATIFFEGGFSAYKKEVLARFDPYNTGSDDCGTVIKVLETNFSTIMIPEAEFFTTFPTTWKGMVEMKYRRANQLVRIFLKYAALLTKNKIRTAKALVIKNLLVYLLTSVFFFFFMATTIYLMVKCPIIILLLLIFLVPKVREYLIGAILNYLILLYSIVSILLKRKFEVWKKPMDRILLTEEMLLQNGLI